MRFWGPPCTHPWLGPNYTSPYVGSASLPAQYFKICVISVMYLILDYSISSIFTTCPYPYILGISPFYLRHLCGWAHHPRFIGGIWTLLCSHNEGRPMYVGSNKHPLDFLMHACRILFLGMYGLMTCLLREKYAYTYF